MHRIWQKTLQLGAQRICNRAQQQSGGSGVENGDALVTVNANDGIQRRINHRFQPPLTGVQLVVAFLELVALCQQGALVNDGAHELCNRRAFTLGDLNAGDVQIGLNLLTAAQRKNDFVGLAVAGSARGFKCLSDTLCVCGADIRHKRHQQPVMPFRLERIVCHGIRLDDHVMLIQHQQRQWHAGEQCLKPLGCAFCHRLAVVQNFVLDLQFVLVVAQLGNQGRQGVIVRQILGKLEHRQGLQRHGVQVRQRGGRCRCVFAVEEEREVRTTHRHEQCGGKSWAV